MKLTLQIYCLTPNPPPQNFEFLQITRPTDAEVGRECAHMWLHLSVQ